MDSFIDLAQLSNDTGNNSNESIAALLHARYKQDKPYIQLGHHRLVIVNPFKPLDILNDAALEYYANKGYKDLLAADGSLDEPHVYDFATRVYFVMRRQGEDQAIVLSGISGSGKSTTHRHLMNELLLLSTHSQRESKLRQQILGAQIILSAFTTASTIQNDRASQCTQLHTLQFNERGRIVGSHIMVSLLDKFRVVGATDGGNYHIFYQLLAGTSNEEKQALHLNHTADHFAYLRLSPAVLANAANNGNTNVNSHGFSGTSGVRDEIAFGDLKAALKQCGFKSKTIAQLCQLLVAILHLGNIQFVGGSNGNIGGGQESCRIKNKETLSLVAAALGIATAKLETALTHKLKLIGKEFCTAFLTMDTAVDQRDALARSLYAILVLWIVEQLNRKLNSSRAVTGISIFDPTLGKDSHAAIQAATFHDLCIHFAAEKTHHFLWSTLFDSMANINVDRREDGFPQTHPWPPISTSLPFFLGTNNNKFAIVPLLNRESERYEAYALDATDVNLVSTLYQKKKRAESSPSAQSDDFRAFQNPSSPSHSFAIQHHFSVNPVDYSVAGFLERNIDAVSPDFVHLFRYNCTNSFIQDLFESSILVTEIHPRDERTIIKAQLPSQYPSQLWTAKQNKKNIDQSPTAIATVMNQVHRNTNQLLDRLAGVRLFQAIHIKPNIQQKQDIFDAATVAMQLQMHSIPDILRQTRHTDWYSYTHENFLSRYRQFVRTVSGPDGSSDWQQIETLMHIMQWTPEQCQIGKYKVWLAFDIWRDLENHLRLLEKEARAQERERLAMIEAEAEAARKEAEAAALAAQEAAEAEAAAMEAVAAAAAAEAEVAAAAANQALRDNPFDDHCGSEYNSSDEYDDRTDIGNDSSCGKTSTSQWGDEEKGLAEGFGPNMDMSKMVEDYRVDPGEQVEEVPITSIRHWWSRFVWLATWWIPSCALRWLGKMDRQDVQMAWREKVTLCLLIFLFSGSIIFFIVGLGPVICQGTKDLYSAEDVTNHQTMADYWVSIRGKVYDLTKFVANDHGTQVYMASRSTMEPLAGRDLSNTFPPPLTTACAGLVTDPTVTITPNETLILGPFVHFSGPQQLEKGLGKMQDANWITEYFEPTIRPFKKGDLVIRMKQIQDDYKGWGRLIGSIDDKVYDLTDYMATARKYPMESVDQPNYHYLDPSIETLFQTFGGKDVTEQWQKYTKSMDETTRMRNLACLDNMFYIGRLDYRDSLRCTFVNYLLLSFAVLMSLVILIKFLAALQFGGAPTPEDHDKFVICQVPCYTEDEESLRKTIDSLTVLNYDDKRKLLFLIADGMIIGSGNDKPTPRILLDILGHPDTDDPESLMFKSIGEGSKQLNYGKVYSGLYEHEGHVVPYVVVVKVGKSTEHSKPGNRGKRDSQIICMNFLSKVHFDSEMTPLELEIYYQIRQVIGVDPSLYEYILMVDSDTEVYPDALNRLVSCMLHDSRIIGLCGETELGNEDRSWTTMIQVYEYYISHHLVKAFESLFGSVTCLPGCFCMYRIRSANKRQPLIVSPAVIHGYSDNQVDTLHKKNLLHLGEDRYLTTLMMKNFPQYKMMFTPYAKCRTVAPDQWRVLLSQRRRWINSTIHNLLELILLQELCGFCCLSMRFVVMTDLIGTITLPSSVIYLIYLIYEAASGTGPVPMIALGMLAGAYGLQALIFIMKRQWQHIGWMIIYIFAIPIFSFFIPIYAFWHFDDFSWGNTRVVVGDKKKQIIVTDDEKFDEKMIPLKRWAQYEMELWESKTARSYDDVRSRYTDSKRSSLQSVEESHVDALQVKSAGLIPPLIQGFSEQNITQFTADLTAALHPVSQQQSPSSKDPQQPPMLPEDEDLEREIYRIMTNANLMTLTKKQVRDQLSVLFGVDVTIKKGFINATIDRILANDAGLFNMSTNTAHPPP
ncbi:chitin synthase-domain-containing protein [Radiomyces spectabilis]|uniref:chitin synthase-domain-containing protein n=1 Tax=Radiomyces spectabilis TaxID=64574 RepID=UPI00221E6E82|nr:chitin synthase-domain-containing protein [Radiomyces spectabilis]KAI8379313.1 chitin synthase-domain-containing protein [Radiomyces spectabilis]